MPCYQTIPYHSLQAYGVAKLFKANVPEKLIMERSKHTSLEGLCQYERTDMAQELQVWKVLAKSPSESRALRPIQQPLPAVTDDFGDVDFNDNLTVYITRALMVYWRNRTPVSKRLVWRLL